MPTRRLTGTRKTTIVDTAVRRFGREAYGVVREELSDRNTGLADLEPTIVALAQAFAKRNHKKWPPRPRPDLLTIWHADLVE
jgi:hypothetical protein